MKTTLSGYPRIGDKRELKRAIESYWAGKSSAEDLLAVSKSIRRQNWLLQKEAGIDLIPSNDFSLYDQVLDLSYTLGAIPERYRALDGDYLTQYFAMARGLQNDKIDVIAMEMTKWFDTNYHYIVPEFTADQQFALSDNKPVREFNEALALGIKTKPVVIGPVTYLLLGKEKGEGFCRLDLLPRLLPAYIELLQSLEAAGAEWIQIDEPCLVTDLSDKAKTAYRTAFAQIRAAVKSKLLLASYFGGLGDNADLATSLGVDGLQVDLVRAPEQAVALAKSLPTGVVLSAGVVDGRNIWKNDFEASIALLKQTEQALGNPDRLWVSASSSLMHVPCDLDLEADVKSLPAEVKRWLAFAKQKVAEVSVLRNLIASSGASEDIAAYATNQSDIKSRRSSGLTHNPAVREALSKVKPSDYARVSPFAVRQKIQHEALSQPLYPTTTIGSFPQTTEVRQWRAQHKKGILSDAEYEQKLKEETERCIRIQESIGLDVLVHGEFERNDMVEYFGEQLDGFGFSGFGWVQSYGTRCVKPPIIYGDVDRPTPMTVAWSAYAQSLTSKPMKGMLTGPVTILEWSFVRNDQPRKDTCNQIALAIRKEVQDLERAGIRVIQIDEPALREGLPLRKAEHAAYLDWAVKAFCLATTGVADKTQIHTHMCYAEFGEIIEAIAGLDADVITIECSRSQMELLDTFRDFKYPNEVGPGVYDIHSKRVPSTAEIVSLIRKAAQYLPKENIWVNPDCGLKTRDWAETEAALKNMVQAAHELRA